MKAQQTTQRKSFQCRFFLLLVLAALSPASLVCAQTSTDGTKDPGSDQISTLVTTVTEQQAQIKRQQKEIDSLKKPGPLGTANDNGHGGTIVGSGTPVKHIISVTQSLVFSDPNSSSVDVSVPGAQLTDLVMIGVPDSTNDRLFFRGAVVNNGQVRVTIHTAVPVYKSPTQPMLIRIVVIGF